MIRTQKTVTINVTDLANLLLAALLLSNDRRVDRAYRARLLETHNRVTRQAGLQLPPGREAAKCA